MKLFFKITLILFSLTSVCYAQEELLSSPLIVVDMDGDGVEIIPLEDSNVYFDVDGDGLVERTAWVNSDDAILYIATPLEGDPENTKAHTEMKWHTHSVFNIFDRMPVEEKSLSPIDNDVEYYIGPRSDNLGLLGLKDRGPVRRLGQDKDSDGYFENISQAPGMPCKPVRISYQNNKQDGIRVFCYATYTYPAQEVQLEYEDSNLPWNTYCDRLRMRDFSTLVIDLETVTPETEQRFLRKNMSALMCLEQGYKPKITEDDRKNDPVEMQKLENYKPGKYWDLIK